MVNYSSILRDILQKEETVLVPGCFDSLSGKLLKQAGFNIIYMTGSGVTASLLGKPDLGFLSMTEMIDRARYIVNSTEMPLICDADTGYGNALNVMRTVQEYENAGVAGIHLEDQVAPKKCGHFEGKEVISAEEMVKKLEAAQHARKNKDFLIIARSDARAVLGFEEVLRRGRIYREAGADMLFIEAPQSEQELQTIAKTFSDIPLLINIVEGGKTPVFSIEYFKELGFKIVLYPTSGIRIVMKALQDFSEHLFTHGNTEDILDNMVTFEGRNQITGLSDYKKLEERFLKL